MEKDDERPRGFDEERREEIERYRALASPKTLQGMFRLIMPRPEVLPLMADAFGSGSWIYDSMRDIVEGVPPTPIGDIMRFRDFLDVYGEVFYDSLPLRPDTSNVEPSLE